MTLESKQDTIALRGREYDLSYIHHGRVIFCDFHFLRVVGASLAVRTQIMGEVSLARGRRI